MRGRTGVILAAMIAGFYLTGCLSGITAGIILGSDGGGGHGRGNNAAPSVAITTAFPPSVPLLEDVTVDFSVSDQEGDLVDILVEVSQDGGVTYLPATVTGTLTGLSASPAGWPATITWDTYADVGSTAQNDIRLRVTPFDPKQGTPGMTGNLTVDNTHLPDIYEVDNDTAGANPLVPFAAAQVHSIHEPGDLDYVSIQVTSNIQRYTIETSNLTGGDTILTLFDTDGITILAENDDRAGGGIASRVDFIFPSLGTYFARVRDTTSAYLYVYDLTLTVVPPTTPSATVETPTGPVSGPVTITYVLIDPDENPVSISVELSQDGGSSFTSATEMPGPPSDGTTGLQTSALGVTHQFVWNSVSDVGTTDQADIQIRLTPFDSATGTPSTTASFRVDNLAPQIASAEYIDMDFDGPDFGDTLEITFSEPIVLGSPTLSAFSLPVGGDTFGNASFILSGPGADQITILLGSSPSLIVAGVFDPASLSAGSPSGMDISASLPSNAITDDAGNEATNYGDPALDDDGVDIGSPDVATPFLGTASAQALSGASNDEVGIQFSEPVIAADAEDISLFVLESPSGSPVDMGGAGVFYNPTTLTTTITLTDTGPQMDNLAYQGSFRIIVTGVRDVAGNPITPGSFLSGTVGGDGASPALLSVNQNLVAGPGGETVDLQFDEAMDPLTANDPVHYAVSGGQLTLSAVLLTGLRQVRIVFDSPIVPGVTTIDVADVRDLAGNVIAAIAGRAIGGPDATPPGLSGIGAVAISGLLNDQISVTFTESVDVTDATDLANFALESPTGIPIDMAGSAISYSAASATTTITLSSTGPSADNLQFGASAQVTVDNVRDLSGNPIAAGSSFAGTVTGDNTPPQILTVRQDLAPDPTGATVEVTFDEALDRASAETSANYTASGGIGTTSATQTPSGERVQVLLTAPVVSGKDTLSVLAVKDAAGNPMVSASNLTMTSTDSTPPVATIVQPADGADVSQSVTVTGTATDDHSLITAIRVNGMAASTGDDFANWTAAIALPTGTQSITVEAEDFNGNVDPSAAQITVNVQGNTPPKATVSTPGGTQIGDVPVAYRLIDDDSDLISISVEYSLDGGGSFFSATESLNPLSEGTLGLSSSSDPGTLHVFVWDSLADLGLASTTQARIRITPSDAVTGTAGVTANFAVNNLGDPAPFIVGSVFEDTEGNGVGQGDRITVLFNEPVVLNTASVSAFSLPVAGDTFGSGATVAAGFASTEIVITLGSVPILTVPGRYVSPVAGMPSGIDISQTMPAGAIEDSVGNDAIPVSSTLSTGSGLDGPFDSVTYTSGDLPGITKVGATITVDTDDAAKGGIYEFTSFVIAPSDMLVAYGSNPLVIQATGNITVDGTIDLSGQAGSDSGRGLPAGSGGVPRAAGGAGGAGGDSSGLDGSSGLGAGGGGGGITGNFPGGGGGGASHGTRGLPGVSGFSAPGGGVGASYGDPYLSPIRGGSGGGGAGGATNGASSGGGGGGGAGGGAIRMTSGANVTISGTIVADGGAGGNADRTSSGGGGSGGAIHIQAGGSIFLNGSGALLARLGPAGTASGSGSRSGGDGGQGRIRLQDSDGIASGSGAIDPAPAQGALKIDVSGGFRVSASILEPRRYHSAVLLRDGNVLITGAVQDTSGTSSSLAQIYDPKAEMVASAGLMFQDYSQRSITLLPSGDVLIAGGIKNQVSVKFDMELYRHATETFSTLPALERARGGHTATLLPNGLVLIAGGGTNTAEVYDWVLEDSTLLSSTMATARSGHSATLSGDGRLLIAGGEDGGGSFSSTEWFDISMQTFVPGPPMNMARAYHVAALLPTGEILVAGGEDGLLALDTAEIFDPILNSFTLLTATLTGPRTRIGSAGYLPDGTILLVGGGGQSADIFDPWIRIFRGVQGLMTAARIDHTVTKLSSDQVLIIGGLDPVSNAVLDSTEIFTLEPRAGEKTFLVTGAPGTVRDLASGTRLSDGRVLLAGGNDGGASVASSETYDLVAGSFQPDGAMGTPREGHAAVLLPTGEVLVMGGIDTASGVLNTAETYDPFSGSWTPTASLMDLPRFQPEAILLWSGAVFVCGGTDGVSALEMSEVYDPLTRTFTPSGNMMAKRLGHAVAPLPDGRILVTGGEDDIPLVLSSAEIYDPIIGFFSPTGGMGSPRRGHSSTLLPDGRVLVVGGASDGTTVEGSTEIYDFTTGLFSPGPPMGSPRFGHTAVLLPNGTVLIAGGKATISGLDEVTSEVYSPVADQFLPVGSMSFGRSAFPLVLMGDGRVLAVGAGGGADLYTP